MFTWFSLLGSKQTKPLLWHPAESLEQTETESLMLKAQSPGSSDQQQKMSGQNFNFQPAMHSKLWQKHDENLEEVWQNPFFAFSPNHLQAEAAVRESQGRSVRCVSAALGEVGTAPSQAQLCSGTQQLPGQCHTKLGFLKMFQS